MSTLTVCPYCSIEMRFDAMKEHLDHCGERTPLAKPSSISPSKYPVPPAAEEVISGLDFYHRLNKLSRLSRPTRSTSDSGGNRLSTSSVMHDAVVAQQCMGSPTSLTIDITSSHSRRSVLSRENATVESRKRSSLSWAVKSNLSGGAAVPPAQQQSSPPSIQVDLRSATPEADVSWRGAGASVGSASVVPSNGQSQSADPLSASSVVPARAVPSNPLSATASSHRGALHRQLRGTARETQSLHCHPTNSVHSAPPSARRASVDGVSAVGDDSALPSTIAELSSAHSSAPAAISAKCTCETPIATSFAASTVSSMTSSQRPMPQLSSFAIRLRGNKGSSASPQKTPERTSRVPLRRLHDSDDIGDTQRANNDTYAASLLGSVPAAIRQMKVSLWQVQRLVRQQQGQYSAFLRAHRDLQHQLTAQQGACNEVVRRSMDQAAAMEAALQEHTTQGRREQAAMQENIASLWAIVSDIHQRLHSDAQLPANALAASHPNETAARTSIRVPAPPTPSLQNGVLERQRAGCASQLVSTPARLSNGTKRPQESSIHIMVQRPPSCEESTYYSDIASFIQPDVTATSSLSALLHPRKDAVRLPAQVRDSAFAKGLIDPPAPRFACASSFASGAAAPLPTAAHVPPYVMDVQQQQQRHHESMEDRVSVMLHAKPTVVLHHSPWK
ncbi:hypothetical protein LPMP_356290 [Leishmania panamensis]|uniref:Uncharacterized protein n=1 Tax=Leishmania panamensis TaxID=5679 RepID=A0A088S308_LEIPA|nr:hypothetical protein LPMP_356290 [Leishmania panamensis]AIO02758.1 hypothetical protein LPMP_356290 [Leishmania panamensis]